MAAPTRLVTEEMWMTMYKEAEFHMLGVRQWVGSYDPKKAIWRDEDKLKSDDVEMAKSLPLNLPREYTPFVRVLAMAVNGIKIKDVYGEFYSVVPNEHIRSQLRNAFSPIGGEHGSTAAHKNTDALCRFLVRVLPPDVLDGFLRDGHIQPLFKSLDVSLVRQLYATREEMAKERTVAAASTEPAASAPSNEAVLRDILADLTALQRKVAGLVASIEGKKK